MATDKNYSINTGEIYKSLCKKQDLLIQEIDKTEQKIKNLLINKKLVFIEYSKQSKDRILSIYSKNDLKIKALNIINKTHPTYLFKEPIKRKQTKKKAIGISLLDEIKNEKFQKNRFNLYRYGTSYELNYINDRKNFEYFFALKTALLDRMRLIEFLNYHLRENFENDKDKFYNFLAPLLIEYKSIITNEDTRVIITAYFNNKLPELNNAITKDESKLKENPGYMNENGKSIKTPGVSIKWTNKDNKNDFVKIIYAMHEAKLINNGEGEITKIVEYLGSVFNVGLSKSWQSNLSKNKNDQNTDYDHTQIFDKIKKAYKDYLEAGEI